MNKFKSILKVIQILLLLVIPVIVFYWVLWLVDLEFLNVIAAILGLILDPIINLFGLFFHYEIEYTGYMIDFTPIALVVVMFVIFLLLGKLEQMIDAIQYKITKDREENRIKTEQINKEQMQKDYVTALAQNKVHYLLVKFNKHQTALSYLSNAFGDEEKDNLANDIISSVLLASKKYGGTSYSRLYDETDIFNFVFYDLESALKFAKFLQSEVSKQAQELIKIGANIEFWGVLHCTKSEYSSSSDVPIMEKIVNLAATNEVLTTELFKNKTETCHKTHSTFSTKGVYALNGKRTEVYSIKIG